MPVFVTGGTGFVGGHLVEALVKGGERVRVLARKTSNTSLLEELGVEIFEGDVTDPLSFKGRMKDCDTVYHIASIIQRWLPDKSRYYKVNVEGTKNVLKEALDAGVGKAVYTSTCGTIGEKKGETATEETRHCGVYSHDYIRSKHMAEMEAMKMHQELGLPLIVVNPGAILGPRDLKMTATSPNKMILDFLNGRLPGVPLPDSHFSFVDVRDVAKGHMLAAKKGRLGQRYILSSESPTFREAFKVLSEISGLPAPKKEISPSMMYILAYMMEGVAFFTRKPPRLPLGFVRYLDHGHMVDNSKAKKELGMEFTPLRKTVADTIQWYKEHEYVRPAK